VLRPELSIIFRPAISTWRNRLRVYGQEALRQPGYRIQGCIAAIQDLVHIESYLGREQLFRSPLDQVPQYILER